MTDIPAIIARVRELGREPYVRAALPVDFRDLLDAAPQLADECARLQTELEECRATLRSSDNVACEARAEADAAEAECARLRERCSVLEEALRPLAEASLVSAAGGRYVIGSVCGAPYNQDRAAAQVAAARLALEGK